MAQISVTDAPPVDLPRPFSDDEIDQSFQVEDDRWSRRAQIGDWLILAALPITGVLLATVTARWTVLRALGRSL